MGNDDRLKRGRRILSNGFFQNYPNAKNDDHRRALPHWRAHAGHHQAYVTKIIVTNNNHLIYLHGSDSNSNSGKARLFREWFPGMTTPDFTGGFSERMEQLIPILENKAAWVIIGSSYGGLMGAVFTCEHPTQVRKLILLAPALLRDSSNAYLDPLTGEYLVYLKKSKYHLQSVSVPTIIVHGMEDDIVPLEPVRETAQTLFTDLTYYVVHDDHRLQKSVNELNWKTILA